MDQLERARRARGSRGRSASCSRPTGGEGTTATPSSSSRSPTHASDVSPSRRRIANPPIGTMSAGRRSRSSHSRQNAQSRCSTETASGRRARTERARVAARHRRAVERRVEGLLVEVEPAAQRPAGAPAPRPPLLALHDPGGLPEQVGPLAEPPLEDGERLERVAASTQARQPRLSRCSDASLR